MNGEKEMYLEIIDFIFRMYEIKMNGKFQKCLIGIVFSSALLWIYLQGELLSSLVSKSSMIARNADCR